MGTKGSRVERCKRGHLLNSANTHLKIKANGYVQRECKLCISFLARHRYRFDEDFRELNLNKSSTYYYNVKRPRLRLGSPEWLESEAKS